MSASPTVKVAFAGFACFAPLGGSDPAFPFDVAAFADNFPTERLPRAGFRVGAAAFVAGADLFAGVTTAFFTGAGAGAFLATGFFAAGFRVGAAAFVAGAEDRKSTRLNSSHT